MLHHPRSHHRDCITKSVWKEFLQRSSFLASGTPRNASRADDVRRCGPACIRAQSRHAWALKEILWYVSSTDFLWGGNHNVHTAEQTSPPSECERTASKDCLLVFSGFEIYSRFKALEGNGRCKAHLPAWIFQYLPSTMTHEWSRILLLYPWCTGLKEDFQVVSFVCLSMRGCCVCAFVIFLLVLALAHAGPCEGLLGAAKAELSADNAGWLQVPAVITNRPPLAVLQHLHPPLAKPGAPLQPHISLESRQGHSSIGNKLRHVN